MTRWLKELVRLSWADGGVGACVTWHQHEIKHSKRLKSKNCACPCHKVEEEDGGG